MTKQQEIIQAQVFGTMAFKAGKGSALCHDKNCMNLINGKKGGESLPILEAWTKGWHESKKEQETMTCESCGFTMVAHFPPICYSCFHDGI